MDASSAEFLASLYQPALKRFPEAEKKPHEWARAAAWGQALGDWLGAQQRSITRREYRFAVASLLNFCRKLPWEVRRVDVAAWLEAGLADYADTTKYILLRSASRFYRFACARAWISPAGRRLKLCRADPTSGLVRSKGKRFARPAALNESQLQQLLAAFDRHTPFGRRDHALFTVMLETGLPLRDVLKLRLQDLAPPPDPQCCGGKAGPEFGAAAAWQVVREYLAADGRLAAMAPDDYLFTPLEDLAGRLAQRYPQGWRRRPLSIRNAYRVFKDYVRWTGLDEDRVTPETLRYTGARRLLQSGAGLEEVASFLSLHDLRWVRRLITRLQLETPPDPPRSEFLGLWLPERFRRRRVGAQPGNKNAMKHGVASERFRLSRLGIRWKQFHLLKDKDLPKIIAELKVMMWELLEVPEDSLMTVVKKLDKAGYIVYIRGLLKAYQYKRQLQAGGAVEEEEES